MPDRTPMDTGQQEDKIGQVRVLQVLPALEVGGVEKGTVEIAKALIDNNIKSYVLSAGGGLVHELESNGSRHIELDIGKKTPLSFRHIPTIRHLIQTEKINILHLRSRMPAWVVYFAWLSLPESERPKLITTVHGPYSVNGYSAIMMRSEYIIAVSEFIYQYIVKNYPVAKTKKIITISRGVDNAIYHHNFKPTANWICPWQESLAIEKKTILTLPGRITHWKGQMDFIEVVKSLKDKKMPVLGIIAGAAHPKRNKFYQSLIDQVTAYQLQDTVQFIGQRNDMREVMAMSDVVFSLAKIPEAFGRTALEALSLGTPVVAYDHGGASEVLNKLYPKGLTPANDTKMAADTLMTILRTKPDINPQNPFTLKRMINETLAVYTSAL